MIQLISQMLPYLPAVARFQAGQDEPPPILCYASLGLIILLLVYSIYHSASMKQRMANPQRMLDKKDYGALLAALRYKAANADAKSLNTRLGAAKALRELGAGPGGAKPISDSLNNRIVGHLIQASADKAPAAVDLRANATAALGAYAARITNASLRGRTVTALRDRLADHASVCLEAVKSMGRITSAWALEPIVAANRQNRPDAAKGLLQVLGSLNHDLGPGLLNLFNGSKYSPQIRAAAAQGRNIFKALQFSAPPPLRARCRVNLSPGTCSRCSTTGSLEGSCEAGSGWSWPSPQCILLRGSGAMESLRWNFCQAVAAASEMICSRTPPSIWTFWPRSAKTINSPVSWQRGRPSLRAIW